MANVKLQHTLTSMVYSALVACIALSLIGCTQSPAPQQPPANSTPSPVVSIRSAPTGTRQRVGYYANLNADCSFGGFAKVRTEVSPTHGTVEIVEGEGYTNYPSANQRYQCNTVRSRMLEVFYTSAPPYKGPDEFVHRVIFPGGTAGSYKYVISVE